MKERHPRYNLFADLMLRRSRNLLPYLSETWSQKRENEAELCAVWALDMKGGQQVADVRVLHALLVELTHYFQFSPVRNIRAHDFDR